MTTNSSIDDVLIRLDEIIVDTQKNGSRQGYFAVLYRRMTLAVKEGIINNQFSDGARMEKLDVIFAKRYLDAYDGYQQKTPISKSWQTTFDACNNGSLIVLQHLILGINTHINLDLAIATAATAPGDLVLTIQQDYDKINDIISSLIDEVQDKLTKIWWPLKLIRNIVNQQQDAVINFSIVAARKTAWLNAVALANETNYLSNEQINIIDNTVNTIAAKIIAPGFFIKLILKLVKLFESKDVKQNIELIK
jgi:hypothetical protein